MDVRATEILPDVRILSPKRFGDDRGFFSESWHRQRMADLGLAFDFVQDNESLSRRAGTLRGLHYQAPPFAQAKLVRAVRGGILDVAVDARRGSPTFGRWIAERITAENGLQILVPQGFLHGFITLEDDTHVIYKVDNVYDRPSDGAVRWNDPDLGIDWGLDAAAITLSDKDRAAPAFREWETPFEYGVV